MKAMRLVPALPSAPSNERNAVALAPVPWRERAAGENSLCARTDRNEKRVVAQLLPGGEHQLMAIRFDGDGGVGHNRRIQVPRDAAELEPVGWTCLERPYDSQRSIDKLARSSRDRQNHPLGCKLAQRERRFARLRRPQLRPGRTAGPAARA